MNHQGCFDGFGIGGFIATGGPNGTDLWGDPFLLVPGNFSSVDPRWSGCKGGDYWGGSHDPPKVLSPVALNSRTTIALTKPTISAEPGSVLISS